MNGVRGIESLAAGDGRHNLFHTLGPTLLISMGYIDLGKWVATVEAGSRFGYDLVLMVVLFNFSAVIYQYLSLCIGMVTGKNLAEICHEEYDRVISIILGVQTTLSLLSAEITMIAGIAVGFNLVFEYSDTTTSIFISSAVVSLLPYIGSRLDKRMAGTLNACIAGFALLCFVLGLLVSQPKIPVNVNAMFPKLSGESAYSLMALLGGNVIANNFYVHSLIGQVQRRSTGLTLGSLFHDHLFSILFIFTGVFLVNYVLLSSAADESQSSNMSLIHFQDAIELMNQICTNSAVPIILLVILIFSSHIISLTSIISSNSILKNLFGVKLPHSAHHMIHKGLAIIPTVYCAKVAGSEGIYQLLILCPVIQAMLIPSCVIPVFRVSSSRSLMGRYRISLYVEILAVLSFVLILFTNLIFAAEILFGDSTWTNNLKGNTESPVLLPHIIMVLISFASIAFALFLAVTPLKSASNEAETQELSVHSQRERLDITHNRGQTSRENVAHEEVPSPSVDTVPRDSSEGHQRSALEHTESSDTAIEPDHDAQQQTVHRAINPEAQPSPYMDHEEPKSVEVHWMEPMPKVCTDTKVERNTADNIEVKSTAENIVKAELDVCTPKENVVSRDLELEKSTRDKAPSFTSDSPPSVTLSRGKDTDTGNVSGNLQEMSGLGRAARRQLGAILDEFWRHLFDYHGKLTQEANNKRVNFLIGLDFRAAGSAVRNDTRSTHFPNRDTQNSGRAFLERNTELYSNLQVPSYSDNQFYQPTTIHGYQLSNYLKGMNASQNPHSSTPLDPWQLPRSSESVIPNYTDSVVHTRNQNVLGSLGASSLQSPTLNRLSTMMADRSYHDPASVGGSENVSSSAYSKKYHSSPDISAVIAANRNALLNETYLGHHAANISYLSRLASEKSRYVDSEGRSSSPLAFNELSQHNVQKDILSIQSSINTSTKSLWAQQPFEQLFGVPSAELSKATKEDFSYSECESELLKSLRFCIVKLLKLEGSRCLFRQNGGCDENLIDQVSEAERVSQQEIGDDRDANSMCQLPKCGHNCVWQASLVVSFGVWCIRRVLDLCLVESRPELWGKYTYVLNRLQGILDPAFSGPRKPLMACACLGSAAKPIPGAFTTAATILGVIKDVEQAVSGRKGRSGTAAGDVAFPKGKENLASVLKRYKRRLSGKPSAGQ